MRKDIIAVIWNDAFQFDEDELGEDTFCLAPTLQVGVLYDEDKEKIRLVHSYSLNHDEHDFMVIPKSLIIKRKKLGLFDKKNEKILPTANEE